MEFSFSITFLLCSIIFLGPFDIMTFIAFFNLILLSLCYAITCNSEDNLNVLDFDYDDTPPLPHKFAGG